MSKTNNEVKLYMKHRTNHTQETAAAKASMTAKTGRKYEKSGLLPSQSKQVRQYKTRIDPFARHEDYIKKMYLKSPTFHAKTILQHLITIFPEENYKMSQLRTLERRIEPLRVLYGANKEIYFPQELKPGIQSQSDWTRMNSLGITINGDEFKHLLFHFMLPYSCWESVYICYSESFDSLANGYQKAVTELGKVPRQHKTDNSSTATKKALKGREFTSRYLDLLDHYNVTAIRNNPGKGNENGSVEKSHDLFKTAVDQALLLRGTRDFKSIDDYREFLEIVVSARNDSRVIKMLAETALLMPLPSTLYEYRELMEARVNKFGLIRIKGCSYSLPSMYIGTKLDAIIGRKEISLYYEDMLLEVLPKSENKVQINYRHIIDNLIKKPGAFENYKYRECLYPQPIYKLAYELLELKSKFYVKEYLQLLQLAKNHGEGFVASHINQHMDKGTLVESLHTGEFQQHLLNMVSPAELFGSSNNIHMPSLSDYDLLIQGSHKCN